ncbi:hypothetical protein MAR_033223 [Mya arenaria]|uniref:Uncharacterized protein n=1 Tax=Mya arenaria TaxID=6604 RepID=A0ABY7GC70_MYAAR|nr:uncharacterized protein LOC128223943 [Mya arenaria]XP_052789405.1 uncharacterized protein LOC128223943 [Mya arenaria]XP_052789406.1 uncharacterized protein LOC128223943 [Mya arenaria]XP_052789407.1 uncharacterized protein LOC128223943 [Mya arenaria]XP_052789408.1 uncharacterized protein LOC128223943 [Mya arenaria]XP_052789409.1 uncharacterized protein LOC128223943 [Mya arenaria]WAR30681.1 hypothetical protein MAR_033223 [Mya arenaria]
MEVETGGSQEECSSVDNPDITEVDNNSVDTEVCEKPNPIDDLKITEKDYQETSNQSVDSVYSVNTKENNECELGGNKETEIEIKCLDTINANSLEDLRPDKVEDKDHEHDSGTDLGPDDHIVDDIDTKVDDNKGAEDIVNSEDIDIYSVVMGNNMEGEGSNVDSESNVDENLDNDPKIGDEASVAKVNDNCDKHEENTHKTEQDLGNQHEGTEDKEQNAQDVDKTELQTNQYETKDIQSETVDDMDATQDNTKCVEKEDESDNAELSVKPGDSSYDCGSDRDGAEVEIDKEQVANFIKSVLSDIQEMVKEDASLLECNKVSTEEDSATELAIPTEHTDDETIQETDSGLTNDLVGETETCICGSSEQSEELTSALDKDLQPVVETDDKLNKECSDTGENLIPMKITEGDKAVVPGSAETTELTVDDELTAEQKLMENQNQKMQAVEAQLSEVKTALHSSHAMLQNERAKHNQEMMTLKLQLYHSQMTLKQQKSKSEGQMQEVMSQLLFLEGKLKQDQTKVKAELRNKDLLIGQYERETVKLKDQNEQLLNAIKEICAKGGMNGYMRDKRKNGHEKADWENGGKSGKDKKGHNSGKLGNVKDKFLAKNRSSFELNSFNLEKYLINKDRLCSSHEDLRRIGSERKNGGSNDDHLHGSQRKDKSPKDKLSPVDLGRVTSISAKCPNDRHQQTHSQNFFSESDLSLPAGIKSTSESSYLSEGTNSSGIYSVSDHDLSGQDTSTMSSNFGEADYCDDDDDDDDRIFSFSSTHINTVIDEEDVMGPMQHSKIMSMGSMPNVANVYDEGRLNPTKNRPHSLSSMDLAAIQQHTHLFTQQGQGHVMQAEDITPPNSPSYHGKPELTPFQTFKTMFKRKGSKNKGKKRSVSLSQTTNKEYSEALKKHFQKYDMQ